MTTGIAGLQSHSRDGQDRRGYDEQVRRIVGFIPQDPNVVMNEVFIFGFSLGAAIAIGAASADTDHYIRGIVVDSPYANLKDVASRYVRSALSPPHSYGRR